MTKTALIDGDILKYQMGWAVQKTHWTHQGTGESFENKTAAKKWYAEVFLDDFDEDEWEVKELIEPWENCRWLIDNKIGEIMYATEADEAVVCLSPHKCFRDELATIQEYKGNRPDKKPTYAEKIVQHLETEYNAVKGNNLEADDVLGLLQTPDTVICTIDKDLKMIPGANYNFNTGEYSIIDVEDADRWFFVQLIAGDSTDNIKGIPGMGIKKAENFVDTFSDDLELLVSEITDLYETHYPGEGEEAMHETAALVWILRKGETPETAGWRKLLNVET